MGLSVQAKTAARPERSVLVITEAAGLTSCSVSAGYCSPPHRGSAFIASLMCSGSLFISGCPPALCAYQWQQRRLLPWCAEELLRSLCWLPFHGWLCCDATTLNLAVSKRICRTCGLLSESRSLFHLLLWENTIWAASALLRILFFASLLFILYNVYRNMVRRRKNKFIKIKLK